MNMPWHIYLFHCSTFSRFFFSTLWWEYATIPTSMLVKARSLSLMLLSLLNCLEPRHLWNIFALSDTFSGMSSMTPFSMSTSLKLSQIQLSPRLIYDQRLSPLNSLPARDWACHGLIIESKHPLLFQLKANYGFPLKIKAGWTRLKACAKALSRLVNIISSLRKT